MARYSNTVQNRYFQPVVGANAYVYTLQGELAELEADGGGALDNPVVTDEYGNFYFNANDGIYTIAFHYGGQEILQQNYVQVGTGPVLPQEIIASLSEPSTSAFIGTVSNGTGATARTIQEKVGDTVSAKDFGAVGNDSGNDAPALQKALDYLASIGGGTLEIPGGIYRIGATLTLSGTVSGIRISGKGQVAVRLKSMITGAGANPMIKVDTTGLSITLENLELIGNSVTGAGGNGHALACISPDGSLSPQIVNLYNVNIRGFQGTGKDHAGASVPAAGWYGYKSTSWSAHGCIFTNNAKGLHFDTVEDASFHGCIFDANYKNSIYFVNCHAISSHGGTAQDSGSGGATDGVVYLNGCDAINWFGGELKNGNPYLLNAGDTNNLNESVLLKGVDLNQLDVAMGHTAIQVGNGTSGLSIENCAFLFVNTITDAVGIEVKQNAGGFSMSGLNVSGNIFKIGSGGTIDKCVWFNTLMNECDSPIIRGNTFGSALSAGSTTTITNGVRIEGDVRSALIESNAFLAGTNWVITNAVYFGTNTLAPVVRLNEYGGAGTITAKVNNAAAISYEREDRAGGRLLLGSATYDPPSLNNGSGDTKAVTVTGCVLGDYVDGFSFTNDLQGLSASAYVSAADTVNVRLQNQTGAPVDLTSGTLRVKVRTQQ